jgi:hypothetical protein
MQFSRIHAMKDRELRLTKEHCGYNISIVMCSIFLEPCVNVVRFLHVGCSYLADDQYYMLTDLSVVTRSQNGTPPGG